MKKGFFTSVAFHVIILIAVLIGLPKVKPFEIDPSEAITVDISTISDSTKLKAQTKTPDKPAVKPAPKASEAIEKAKPAPKVEQEKKLAKAEPSKAEPPPPKPEPPKPEPKPEPDPPPEPKKVEPLPPDQDALNSLLEADQKAIDDKRKEDERKKKVEEKKKKAEEAKKLAEQKKADAAKKLEADKKKRKLDMAQLDKLLNKENEEAASTLEKKSTSGEPETAEQDVQGDDSALEATISALVQRKFEKCWDKPPAAIDSGAEVVLSWEMDRNGNVVGQPVVVAGRADQTFYDVTLRSAIAAVLGCQPYTELPKDKFEVWREFEWKFVP
jgi:outer membrane biosynthesis protein TonB